MNAIQEHLNQLAPSPQLKAEDQEPNFDDIHLTPDELKDAIKAAKQEKFLRQKREEWYRKISQQPVEYVPTAKDFFNHLRKSVSQSGKPFQLTDQNKYVITQLCLYFSNDHRFGTEPKTGITVPGNLELHKGILLMGKPGTGKSHLMNFFAKNPRMSYSLPTCVTITQRYRSEGQQVIEQYSCNPKAHLGHAWGQKELGYCFHDLGAEEKESKNFGNSLNVLETILFNRYEAKLPFHSTHITTNLDANQIRDYYGSRISNRMAEMFNVFECNWESFRV